MAKVTIQKGHCFRTSGATGGNQEQKFANEVGDIAAAELRTLGHDVKVVLADDPIPANRDIFIALHTDGSVNVNRRGASVGYPSNSDGRAAAAWKRGHARAGYAGGFFSDNYTAALRSYYGFGKAMGYRDEYLAEHGHHSNLIDFNWMHSDYRRCAMVHVAVVGELYGHPKPVVTPPVDATPTLQAITATALPDGRIWTFARDGGVFTEGGATFAGVPPAGHRPIVAGRALPSGGYRLIGDDGGVFNFGGAQDFGSMGGQHLNAPIFDYLPSKSGYTLIGGDGGVFNFGDAPDFGGAVGHVPTLAHIITCAARTPDEGGYWLVGRNGAVHARGNAGYFGSLTELGITPNRPVEAILPSPSGQGYILVCGDGGLFAFGDAPAIQPYGALMREVYAGARYIEDSDWFIPGQVLFLVSNLGERYLLSA